MEHIAVVVSRFNEDVTTALKKSCLDTLAKSDFRDAKVVEVPGGYELPWTVNELALSKRYAAIIALGCILKGETPQNDHIARSTVQKLHEISLATRTPVILGVITPNTYAQAKKRTKGEYDRGREAALACIEMLKVRKELAHGS